MDRLDAIRLFVRLVECGSFSAVGRAEGIGQPAVSKQISALEKHLGAQLVLRTSRQVVITDAGQTFYESAKQLMADFDEAESSVGLRQQSPRGVVRLNTAPAHGRLCVLPLLPEFFRRYPEITIEVSVSERPVDLIGEGIDLAVRHGPLQDSALIVRTLTESALVLVASPAYLAEHGAPLSVADLHQHNCVVFANGGERRTWRFKDNISHLPNGSLLTGDAEHIRMAVLHGFGIAQAPRWLFEDEIRHGQVQILLPDTQDERLAANLVYASGRSIPMRLRVLIDYLISKFERPSMRL